LSVTVPTLNPFQARGWLALAVVVLLAASEAALFAGLAQSAVRDILNVLVGVVIAKFGTVYDYYFGSAKPPPAD
jgi:hypothetical protein